MFEIITTGIIIGVLVSAPLGPLGILCVQRTIHKGKLSGIVTGAGATASDLIYAILVGFSMNFIVNFIEQYQFLIQITGSIVLFVFGYYIFRKNPEEGVKDGKIGVSERSLLSSFTTAFGLCFSNPIIIFIFIALFARYNFFSPDYSLYQVIVGILSIIGGAFLWWVFLTSMVSLFRGKFNTRGLKILNMITGGVLMILAIVGIGLGLYNFL